MRDGLWRIKLKKDIDEINQRWHKQMERYSMFLCRKNQYCENHYTTKSNLQIWYNPYQITNGIVHRTRTKNFTIHMETQKTPNSQSSIEKLEEPTFLTSDYITKLQPSRQYGPGTKTVVVEQDRKPRNKPIEVTCFWQRRQKYTMGKRQPLQ